MKAQACVLWIMGCGVLSAQAPPVSAAATGDLARSRVFTAGQGAARTMPNGGQSRDLLQGTLQTGEALAVHESMQPAGARANPLHTIQHSELIVVREGTLGFQHDGVEEKAKTGDVIYVKQGTLHTVRNAGSGPARYVVIAIGGDVKR